MPAKADQQPGTDRLIEATNEILVSNLGEHFTPIALDNFGSHRAAKRWLVDAAIPLEEAIVLLRRQVARFSLEKSKGQVPRSLGYFTKPILRAWDLLQREREQLALLPAIDMEVTRVQAPAPVIGNRVIQTAEKPPASLEEIAAMREEFEHGLVERPARL